MPQSKEQIAAYMKEYSKEYREKNKEQIAAYNKEYNKINKEQISVQKKKYRENNKEKIDAYKKKWKENNKEQIAAYKKKWKENNKEQIAAYKKKYRENNKEKLTAYDKKYRENNKEKINAYNKEHRKKYTPAIRRKWRYGISSEDYDAMLEEQDNKCKICLVDFNDEALTYTDGRCTTNVDHCHTTNKVRGILCGSCNRGLGQFKDNIKLLTKAINYLEEENEPIKQ